MKTKASGLAPWCAVTACKGYQMVQFHVLQWSNHIPFPYPILKLLYPPISHVTRYPLATPRFAMHQCTCRKGCMEKCNGVWWYLTGGVRVTPPPVPWSQIHARRHCITKIRDRFMRGRAPNHTGVGGPAQKTEKKKKYAW